MRQLTLEKINYWAGIDWSEPLVHLERMTILPIEDIEHKREIMLEDVRNESAKACVRNLARQRDIDRIRGFAQLMISTSQDMMKMINAYALAIEELNKIQYQDQD